MVGTWYHAKPMPHDPSPQHELSSRVERIREVADRYLRKWADGDRPSEASLLDAHADLLPELASELNRIRRITAAGDSDQPTPSIDTRERKSTGHTGSSSGGRTLRVRCPHCHQPIEIESDSPLAKIRCPHCHAGFSLAGGEATAAAAPLTMVGHFQLVSRLGLGTFGTVWKALDTALGRTVAIKIPRQGQLTEDEEERFFREARMAAGLQHPNVVSVHEVGRDDETLFIVTDLVRGVSLSDWLTARRPSCDEAAELMATVADAVGHAHERGVIHRDLKPGNILMDRDAIPHITDFGLARHEVSELTMTLEGQVLGSPAYMSPEQAAGQGHAAGRPADVYSLGVILFQLLTGELPFRGSSQVVLHKVLHDEPPSPRSLDGTIPRDLETITGKCLQKDPRQRYASASALADDLNCYLQGKPVAARPITATARAWRWCARNPLATTVIGLTFLVAIGAIGATAIIYKQKEVAERLAQQKQAAKLAADQQRDQAESARGDEVRARQRAEKAIATLIEAFRSPDPYHEGGKLEVEDVLQQAVASLSSEFSGEPLTRGRLTAAIGRTYLNRGMPSQAVDVLERAREDFRVASVEDSTESMEVISDLANAHLDLADWATATALYEELIQTQQRVLGPRHEETLISRSDLGVVYRDLGRYEDALAIIEPAVEILKDRFGLDHPHTILVMNRLATVYTKMRQPDRAIAFYEELLPRARRQYGESSPNTIGLLCNLATEYRNVGRNDEGVRLLEEGLELSRKTFGPEHPQTLSVMHNLGAGYGIAGQFSKSVSILESARDLYLQHLGEAHIKTLMCMDNLGVAYRFAGQLDESFETHRAALVILRREYGNSNLHTLSAMGRVASFHLVAHRDAEAMPLLEDIVEFGFDEPGIADYNVAMAVDNLTLIYASQDRLDDAVALRLREVERRLDLGGKDDPDTLRAVARLVELYERQDNSAEVAKWKAMLPAAASDRSPNDADAPPDGDHEVN